MGYVLKAVLSSAQHPEYGQIIQIYGRDSDHSTS